MLKFKNLSAFVVVLMCILTLGACGGDVSLGANADEEQSDSSSSGTSSNSDSSISVSIRTEYFGEKGNLWKPEADEGSANAGLLVVLLAPEFTDRFDSCEVPLIDGTMGALDCNDRVEWSHTPYSCVANGGREHWRANFRCEDTALVRVVCRSTAEEVTFEAPGVGISAVCSRHG